MVAPWQITYSYILHLRALVRLYTPWRFCTFTDYDRYVLKYAGLGVWNHVDTDTCRHTLQGRQYVGMVVNTHNSLLHMLESAEIALYGNYQLMKGVIVSWVSYVSCFQDSHAVTNFAPRFSGLQRADMELWRH